MIRTIFLGVLAILCLSLGQTSLKFGLNHIGGFSLPRGYLLSVSLWPHRGFSLVLCVTPSAPSYGWMFCRNSTFVSPFQWLVPSTFSTCS